MARYVCPICNSSFYTVAAIKRHIEKEHIIEYMDMVNRGKKTEIRVYCYPFAPYNDSSEEL